MRNPEYRAVDHRGFTLIEVLVAFSILSLSLSVMFAILSSGSRTTQISDEYSRAVVLAESKLDELGVSFPLHDGASQGSFDSFYHWDLRMDKRLRRETSFTGDPGWNLFDVTLRVWWQSAGQERDIVLSTLRLAEKE
jgi:general secretion pathway protein I